MYELNDILIIGDSFARNRDRETDWPMAVTLRLTGKEYDPTISLRGKGFGGASWWSTRKCLLEELQIKVPKVLIICHTERSRIPNDFNLGLHVGISKMPFGKIVQNDNESYVHPAMQDAVVMYYKHLYSDEYAAWSQSRWYDELDQILIGYNIPHVIHLPIFDRHNFKSGVTSVEKLVEFADQKTESRFIINNNLGESPFRNHLLEQQNVNLAASLFDTIQRSLPSGTVAFLNLMRT